LIVLAHLDPAVLERELLQRLSAEQQKEQATRLLVVVPTVRLAEHLQRRLAETRAAWLGVEIAHFRSLAHRMLASAPLPPIRLLSNRLLERLTRRVLDELGANRWADFVGRRPGAIRTVMTALQDLRDAAIEPAVLEACCHTDAERDLARIYREYVAVLQERFEAGWVDDAGMIRAALPLAPAHATRYEAIFLHGVYELIGIHLDLIRALDQTTPVTVLLPAETGAPVSEFAESFARRQLLEPGKNPEALDAPRELRRRELLAALYDEQSTPASAPAELFRFRHAQGAAAEVRIAVRDALAQIGRGDCRPDEILIAARILGPYAAAFEEAFDDCGLPWTSSLGSPLRRQPVVHDFMLLLRVVADDFPRKATAELLRSPHVPWIALRSGATVPKGELADRWSRHAGIIGGLDEWIHDLVTWAERPKLRSGMSAEDHELEVERAASRGEQARLIVRSLQGLRDRLLPTEPRSWRRFAEELQKLFDAFIGAAADDAAAAARRAVHEILDEMREVGRLPGEERPQTFDAVLRWFEEAVDGTELALAGEDRGGVRVLDAMQARGLTFKRLHLLGMNSGLFPRTAREDPLLTEALRRRLRERTKRPLALQAQSPAEERLLLAMLLGSASEGISVSWQRADEAGRSKTPSLALREIARLIYERPDMKALLADATHLPSHPAQWLDRLAHEPGLLSPEEAMLAATLGSHGPDSAAALIERYPKLAPGLRMLELTESFGPVDPRFDGRVKVTAGSPPGLSVSDFETLGLCPLKFFFRRVLRVGELEDEPAPHALAFRDVGLEIHRLLERVYRRLLDEKLFGSAPPQELLRRAAGLTEHFWTETMDPLGAGLARRLPILWERTKAVWLSALHRFLDEDLGRIDAAHWRPVGFEESRQVGLDLGQDRRVEISARFDRRLDGTNGTVVGDYKTSGNLKDRSDVTRMLKAQTLQVPLYWLIGGERTRVELLGVGPRYDDADESKRRVEFDGFDDPRWQEGFLETLRTLVDLAAKGSFPLHEGSHCVRCSYAQACRRLHPPTVERETHAPDSVRYRMLKKKSKTKAPTIADLEATTSADRTKSS
jgi:ATP-dependent helicase/DNAse subunit B